MVFSGCFRRCQESHTDVVNHVRFHPDGKLLSGAEESCGCTWIVRLGISVVPQNHGHKIGLFSQDNHGQNIWCYIYMYGFMPI